MGKDWTRREIIKTAGIAAAGWIFTHSLYGRALVSTVAEQEWLKKKAYDGMKGLANLPYFEITEKGLLRLTVDGLDGGIDGHTHFALNSLTGGQPDLLKPHPETRYYLPPDIESSLYVYANQNATPEQKKAMSGEVINSLLPGGSDLTDTHTLPNLLAEMDLLGIEKAVVLPIRYGWIFGDDMTEWYRTTIEQSGAQDRFILCGGIRPIDDDATEEIKKYKETGLKGIKMHPNMGRFYPDDKAAWPAYEACGKHDLPVLIHSGRTGYKEKTTFGLKLYTEDYSDLLHFEEPIAAFPNVRFVLCHAGALQNELAISYAKKYENVWLDIHGQGVDRIQAMIKELGPERLMYGSDWAFYPEAVILARLLIATASDHMVRRMLFSENARRFWKIT